MKPGDLCMITDGSSLFVPNKAMQSGHADIAGMYALWLCEEEHYRGWCLIFCDGVFVSVNTSCIEGYVDESR
jgi:hypothetical protein